MESGSPKLAIKASPSHLRMAQSLAEQVKKEYEEFLVRERAGTLTPRVTEPCFHCKNDFVKAEMILVETPDIWHSARHYCTEECESKGELILMRKAEEEDERNHLFKFRNFPGKWLATTITSFILRTK